MSAAPDGETAAIQIRAPAPAMTHRLMVVTPVGTTNDDREAAGRLVQKSHTIQSLALGPGRIMVLQPSHFRREMIIREPETRSGAQR